jgi:hypothetical protein
MRKMLTVGACALFCAAALPGAATADLAPVVPGNLAGPTAPPPLMVPSSCPSTAAPDKFSTTGAMVSDNRFMASLGQRPTGSPAQNRFIGWLDRRMQALPGMRVSSVPFTINRWDEHGASLRAGRSAGALGAVRISGPVPYALPAKSGGVTAPLTFVANGTAISAADVKGRIVVRETPPSSVPNAAFVALSWTEWDPDLTLTKSVAGNYQRDYLSYTQRMIDLSDAATAGAAGLVFVHSLPYAQV